MKTLILVRHGETELNSGPIPRIRGFLDIYLNEKGRNSIEQTAKYIYQHLPTPNLILSSPLNRAQQTAEIINKELKLQQCIQISQNLNEVNWGTWEGMTYEEALGTTEYEHLKPLEMNPPGGETLYLVQDRCQKFIDYFLQQQEDCILAVSHGSVISILLCVILDIPLNKYWTSYLNNSGIGCLQFENNVWKIKSWGQYDN
ncbi:6-phosphofructo-2-kinase / Fructose-2,6-bisphosphate 2-phosphatase [Spironucleus salmonicida]|uniref:6-phosphofructo-2-kinase / Fructose-2,6-bisphosphate 2-phosphatase n=1 Tax=Spironucleus salmonicida TaxID=348837 RepID=V6LMM7_9EUKA|nr:6-phosphofructo-2-kinase / Fructose-2,6-bisphosphate 2-phosphatase [Spironucleus salmonicida]|eukprot:EST41974.1 Phosphoglycerate mutase [Spironucleus salmonicida]